MPTVLSFMALARAIYAGCGVSGRTRRTLVPDNTRSTSAISPPLVHIRLPHGGPRRIGRYAYDLLTLDLQGDGVLSGEERIRPCARSVPSAMCAPDPRTARTAVRVGRNFVHLTTVRQHE
jgi:hypothetical protein